MLGSTRTDADREKLGRYAGWGMALGTAAGVIYALSTERQNHTVSAGVNVASKILLGMVGGTLVGATLYWIDEHHHEKGPGAV